MFPSPAESKPRLIPQALHFTKSNQQEIHEIIETRTAPSFGLKRR